MKKIGRGREFGFVVEGEERLWAAANKKQLEEDDELALVPEEDREIGEAVDYEEAYANWDSDDEEWEKGLDPNNEAHKEMLAVPRELRYTDEDLDLAIEKLEAKAQAMQNHVRNTINTMEQEALILHCNIMPLHHDIAIFSCPADQKNAPGGP